MAETKKRTLGAILAKEYKYEGLILLFLGIVVTVLGSLILVGVSTEGSQGLVVNENFYFIGEYPTLFAWILIIFGVTAILTAIYPYYIPSIKEMKRVSWPNKKTMFTNSITVLMFVLILSLLFLGYDAILNQVVKFFNWIGSLIKGF